MTYYINVLASGSTGITHGTRRSAEFAAEALRRLGRAPRYRLVVTPKAPVVGKYEDQRQGR